MTERETALLDVIRQIEALAGTVSSGDSFADWTSTEEQLYLSLCVIAGEAAKARIQASKTGEKS